MACSCAGKILFPKYSCATRKCVSGLLIINAESQEKKKKTIAWIVCLLRSRDSL